MGKENEEDYLISPFEGVRLRRLEKLRLRKEIAEEKAANEAKTKTENPKNEYLKYIDSVKQPEPKKRGRPKNIMKGRADIDGNKVTTELNIKKGLQPKVKRALKKSVIAELDNKMIGKGLRGRTISLSSSDSD